MAIMTKNEEEGFYCDHISMSATAAIRLNGLFRMALSVTVFAMVRFPPDESARTKPGVNPGRGMVRTKGYTMKTEAIEIICDLDKRKDTDKLERMGGHHLARLIVLQTRKGKRKRVTFHLGIRTSGDIRAGCTDGVHVSLAAVRKSKDTRREVHGIPWVEVDRDNNPILKG